MKSFRKIREETSWEADQMRWERPEEKQVTRKTVSWSSEEWPRTEVGLRKMNLLHSWAQAKIRMGAETLGRVVHFLSPVG